MDLKTDSGNLINRVKFVILYESLRILSGNGAKQRRGDRHLPKKLLATTSILRFSQYPGNSGITLKFISVSL